MLGNALDIPLGTRAVFVVCCGYYLLYLLDHHEFVSLNVVCRPVDVIYGLQVQRLLQASFAHTSTPGLLLALLVCSRRFTWLERQAGTLGFLVWFFWSSLLLHVTYCLAALLLSPVFGTWMMTGEVHGLFPLLVASHAASIKETDNSTVWLWPLPFHVPVRAFPVALIVLCWLLHFEAHFDIVTAYLAAVAVPSWLDVPSNEMLDRVEQSGLGKRVMSLLQYFDSFVCRPPCGDDGLVVASYREGYLYDSESGQAINDALPKNGLGQTPGNLHPASKGVAAATVSGGPPAASGQGAVCHQVHSIGDDDEELPAKQDLADEYDCEWL